MKHWAIYSLAGIGLVGAGVGLTFLSGKKSWNSETERLVEKLKQSAVAGEMKTLIHIIKPMPVIVSYSEHEIFSTAA